MLPSCCTCVDGMAAPPCDILLSELGRELFASSFFQSENRKLSGVRTKRKTCRMGAENIAKRSAQSLATLLGEISPKTSTTTVTTMVEIVAPASP